MSTTTSSRTVRRPFTLPNAAREFWRHPSPWIIGAALTTAVTARILVGGWSLADLLIPVAMLAVLPFFEWTVHVLILHWRPRRLGRFAIDSLLARKHREHHVDPRAVPLIFIPWPAFSWILPAVAAIGLLAFPRTESGLTFLVSAASFALGYEWCHYLIHSDYKPKTRLYRAIWMNHRQHHYKNEHYWFTVTSAGTADRVFGTHPDVVTVPSSPTAKNLHAARPER
jgi:hypothetical protein